MSSLKHSIYILFPLLFTGCARDPLATMPEFRIMLSDGKVIKTGDIPGGGAVMLIHFDSDCRDCQEEAQTIIDHMDQLKDTRIVFLSVQDTSSINYFGQYFKFQDYPNVIIGRDLDTTMARHFKSGVTPLLALYDKNQKIKAVFEGKANMTELIGLIREIKKTNSYEKKYHY